MISGTGVNRPTHPIGEPDSSGSPDRTIVDLLRRRARERPNDTLYTMVSAEGEAGRSLTYAGLDARARAIAKQLMARGLEGERVLLLHPAGLEFVEAFFGCLYARAIAVPGFPPRANRTLPRLTSMVTDSQARLALTTQAHLERAREATAEAAEWAELEWLASDSRAGSDEVDGETDGGRAGVGGESTSGSDGRDGSFRLPEPRDLAYLQYTSGSTSAPKGVMVSHGNVMANSETIRIGFRHDAESRSLTWLPHFHDMGLIDGVLQPLYSGFPALLMDPVNFLQNPGRWLELISTHRITHTGGPNFAYDLCVRRVSADPAELDLRSWDIAYNGAEPVRAETLERFAEHFAPCGFRRSALYPAYGLAEATLKVSGGIRGDGPRVLHVDRSALEAGRLETAGGDHALVGSGHCVGDTAVCIVDPEVESSGGDGGPGSGSGRGRALGENEIGEIWVTGASVALGYWERPEETAHTFGAHVEEREERFLRTGDLGFLREGELYVTGRLKDLVIIRGRNLYPQDIERTVETSSEGLRPAGSAAFSVELEGEERLVIVQEVERRAPTDPSEVFETIRRNVLETFEVDPAAIVLVKPATVAKTSSGKVQRRATRQAFLDGKLAEVACWEAPVREFDADGAVEPLAQPATVDHDGIVAWLRARIAAAVGARPEAIALDDSLVSLGLDSLRSIELAHEIESILGVAIGSVELLTDVTLYELGHRLSNSQAHKKAPTKREFPESCPLSAGQEALWFLHQLAPSSGAYTIASALELHGAIDTEALERSLRAVIERHPALRTRILDDAENGRPAQVFDVPFEAIVQRSHLDAHKTGRVGTRDGDRDGDRTNRTGDSADGHAGDLFGDLATELADRAYRPFDLTRGPLVRIEVIEHRDRVILLIAAHHTVADLWSLSMVLRDLQSAYAALTSSKTAANKGDPEDPRFAAMSTHPSEFVAWQSAMIRGSEGHDHLRYWSQVLAGEISALELPADRPRPNAQLFRGAARSATLGPELSRALREFARAQDVTLFTALVAAFQAFLSRITGQSDILVGSPAAGRTRSEFAGLVSYLVNPVALRAHFTKAETFQQHLRKTRDHVLDALSHQDYPFPVLVSKLAPPRIPGRSPFFDVMFELRARGRQVRGDLATGGQGRLQFAPGVEASALSIERRAAQFDLSVTVTDHPDALEIEFEYDTVLFERQRIEELLASFSTFLGGAVREPDRALERIPLVSARTRQTILRRGDVVAPDGLRSFVERFEAMATTTPDRTAVHAGQQSVSYRDLDERANDIAWALRKRGASWDTPVGLCLEKSIDLVTMILGIHKVGGAYVPLDPTWPAERRDFVLQDARIRLVVGLPEATTPGDARAVSVSALVAEARAARTETDRFRSEPDRSKSDQDRQRERPPSEALAYIIYTSGTTGRPKGVAVSHGNLTCAMEAWDRVYDLSARAGALADGESDLRRLHRRPRARLGIRRRARSLRPPHPARPPRPGRAEPCPPRRLRRVRSSHLARTGRTPRGDRRPTLFPAHRRRRLGCLVDVRLRPFPAHLRRANTHRQLLRRHRGHHRQHARVDGRRAPGSRRTRHRSSHRAHPRLRARSASRTRAPGSAGRTLSRRTGSHAGLHPPSRSDGRPVRPGPAQQAGRPHVSNR